MILIGMTVKRKLNDIYVQGMCSVSGVDLIPWAQESRINTGCT